MTSSIPVTQTKITTPTRRAEIFTRPRLLSLLDELINDYDFRLVIVAAPAGYGKTSLLVDFATQYSELKFCWYALDRPDRDPVRFLAHFISSIARKFPKFGKSPLAALESMGADQLDLDVLISQIINDIYENITEHFVIVLDDYHLVEDQKDIQYFINRFIQDVSENCHLVLASRILLTLPDLTLMVARNQVGGLSFEELTFNPDEIRGLLEKNYHMDISPAEADELASETEGWVTGLLLSTQVSGRAMANRLRVARVSGVGLYEYMARQILDQQPPDVQEFLLRTSLVDEFNENLCVEVIGDALMIDLNWRALMDRVLQSNVFVLPVGEDGEFLRYHHLFQDFLRDRMKRDRPEETRQIQLKLAQMYIQRQDWDRAYTIYQGLGNKEQIMELVELAGTTMISQGQSQTLSDWLGSLPPEMLFRNPALVSLQGTVTVFRGETGKGIKLLDQAVDGLRRIGDPGSLASTLSRRCAAYKMAGEYQNALSDAEEALRLLQKESQGNLMYADALLSKGTVLHALGQLNEALSLLETSLSAYQSLGDENTSAKVWIEIGRVANKLGKYVEAEEAYKRALTHYQNTGNLNWQASLYNNLGVLHHGRGDFASAASSFEKAIQYARISGSVRVEAYTLASIGELYQELDAAQEALAAYRQSREISQRIGLEYLLFYLNIMEIRLKLAHNDLDDAEALLSLAIKQAEARGAMFEQQTCQVEIGRLQLAREKMMEAMVSFHSALTFFTQQQFETEIPRARLYAMIAAAYAGETQLAAQHANLLADIVSNPPSQKLLVSAAREARKYIEHLREEPELRRLLPYLVAQVERYEQGIPAVRRQIRRHAVVVPFAAPKMTIRGLGKPQVKISDHVITGAEWQVQTARDLFFLILNSSTSLTKEQIGEIFWPDSSPNELKMRFKNTIYRLRHAVGKEAIVFQGDNQYLFNREIDYEYDVELFEKDIAQSETAASDEQKEELLRSAIRHYKGKFLSDSSEQWVITTRERLHQDYQNAVNYLAEKAYERCEFDKALEFCGLSLKEDPCSEAAHRTAMRVYAAQGNRALLVRQYELCRQALDEELGAIPTLQTRKLYDSLIK